MNISNHLILVILLLCCALYGCSTDLPVALDYAYEVNKYYGDPTNPKNYRSTSYYSSDDRLLRTAGSEIGCTDFIYDDSGKLLAKHWSRNCTHVSRKEFMIYNDNGNLLGSYTTLDSLVKLDTVSYEQIYFYDDVNRLVKERIHKTTNSDGYKVEYWREYIYSGGRISEEVTTFNGHTIWQGTYEYGADGKLAAIHRTRGNLTENEFFRYDANGKLLEKRISSTENPISPKVGFSAGNNRKVYEYDSSGFLTREILIGYRGNAEVVTNYIKSKKDNQT